MPARRHVLLFAAALGAAFAAGCQISVEDPGGRACSEAADCNDPYYDCIAPQPEAQRVCQLIYPPRVAADADAGVDAGPVEDVFWCNDVEQFMTTYCADCHGADRSASGNQPFRLDMYEDDPNAMPTALAGAHTKANRIKARTADFKDMPPAGYEPMPTDEERRRIGQWVRGGARFCADGGM